MKKMDVRTPWYHRHSTVSAQDGLTLLRKAMIAQQRAVVNGVSVGASSLRLRTFVEKGTVCSACGLEGMYFAPERAWNAREFSEKERPFHLNLWGVDENGKEILFTHDHTLARALGGSDTLENTTTMCQPCNTEKSKLENRLLQELKQKENVDG